MHDTQPTADGAAGRSPDFEDFVRASSTELLRTAYLLCGDRGHAEDLLQTALLRTARHWRRASRSPYGYTRTVLVNLAKDRWRDRGRQPAETPLLHRHDSSTVNSAEEQLLQRDVLLRAVGALPARQRATLVLRYFEDLPVDEVAGILGCSAGAVKSQTHHALARLRGLLADADVPAPDTATKEHTPC